MAEEDESTNELVEEILEQQSAQALKLSHIDEAITDLRQAMQRLTSSTEHHQRNMPLPVTGEHTIEIRQHGQRVSWLTAGVFLQIVMLGALLVMAMRAPSHPEAPPAPALAYESPRPCTPVAAAVTQELANPFAGATGEPAKDKAEEQAADTADKSGKKKKKR